MKDENDSPVAAPPEPTAETKPTRPPKLTPKSLLKDVEKALGETLRVLIINKIPDNDTARLHAETAFENLHNGTATQPEAGIAALETAATRLANQSGVTDVHLALVKEHARANRKAIETLD